MSRLHTAALGIALLGAMPGTYPTDVRYLPEGRGRSANGPLKSGTREQLRAKRKKQRQAKKRSQP